MDWQRQNIEGHLMSVLRANGREIVLVVLACVRLRGLAPAPVEQVCAGRDARRNS